MTTQPRTGAGRVGVMHVIDALHVGGAERVAVNLANRLPVERYRAHLCTTRDEGPLAACVQSHVQRLSLGRRSTLDLSALRHLATYVREHDVRILHAHGSAVFVTALASLLVPGVSVVWHLHYGRHAAEQRPAWSFRALRYRVSQAIAVSEPLAAWAVERLQFAAPRVSYIPNFSEVNGAGPAPELPGCPGERIVCVANFVPEKDHLTLVRAMALVVERRPRAHLLLVGGGSSNPICAQAVRREIESLGIQRSVSLLGQRNDVALILAGADVGVLSSTAEGLPLALVEYGEAGLPVVVTRVGQCAAVVGDGAAGIVVPAGSSADIADALLALLQSPQRRCQLGAALRERTHEFHNPDRIIGQICDVYERSLA